MSHWWNFRWLRRKFMGKKSCKHDSGSTLMRLLQSLASNDVIHMIKLSIFFLKLQFPVPFLLQKVWNIFFAPLSNLQLWLEHGIGLYFSVCLNSFDSIYFALFLSIKRQLFEHNKRFLLPFHEDKINLVENYCSFCETMWMGEA